MSNMDNLNIDSNPQPKKQANWLVPSFRWFGGCVIGCVSGLLLLIIAFVIGPIALLGFIFLGQYLVFERFVFWVYSSLYGDVISYELNFLFSVVVYSVVWGIIGALFASGKKKYVILGTIMFIIYVALGLLAFKLLGSTMFPT